MKFGIHYAYWVQDWDADLSFYLKKVAGIGFDSLEISGNALLGMSKQELVDFRNRSEDCGVKVIPCHGFSKKHDVGSPDAEVREKGIHQAFELFDQMDILGCNQLGGILYSYWPALEFSSMKEDISKLRGYSLESMVRIAEEANRRGMLLTLEVVNRFENFMFNDTRGALEYLDFTNLNAAAAS